jgi:hypothetical protein
MIPTRIVPIETMPRNAAGKVVRAALLDAYSALSPSTPRLG